MLAQYRTSHWTIPQYRISHSSVLAQYRTPRSSADAVQSWYKAVRSLCAGRKCGRSRSRLALQYQPPYARSYRTPHSTISYVTASPHTLRQYRAARRVIPASSETSASAHPFLCVSWYRTPPIPAGTAELVPAGTAELVPAGTAELVPTRTAYLLPTGTVLGHPPAALRPLSYCTLAIPPTDLLLPSGTNLVGDTAYAPTTAYCY
eukprot:1467872-Rhodomonas_salina.3